MTRVPFQVVSNIMGWSPSTAVRMAKRDGDKARGEAIERLGSATA